MRSKKKRRSHSVEQSNITCPLPWVPETFLNFRRTREKPLVPRVHVPQPWHKQRGRTLNV